LSSTGAEISRCRANLTKSELNAYLKLARFLEGLTEAKLKELAATEGGRELKL
jgi:hypothetical protein